MRWRFIAVGSASIGTEQSIQHCKNISTSVSEVQRRPFEVCRWNRCQRGCIEHYCLAANIERRVQIPHSKLEMFYLPHRDHDACADLVNVAVLCVQQITL